MNDTPQVSIGQLCYEARNACWMAGLYPACWRWNDAVLQISQYEHSQHWTKKVEAMMMTMPKGAICIYEGLPVFRMGDTSKEPAVACVGTRKPNTQHAFSSTH